MTVYIINTMTKPIKSEIELQIKMDLKLNNPKPTPVFQIKLKLT